MGDPRIMCVAGSPRRHGNSSRLLDACVHGIEAAGGAPDTLVLARTPVEQCRGCNACSRDGVCVIEDTMTEVYPRLDAADGFVIATPVFFATVPGTLKAFYDRCQPYWARRYVLGVERRTVRRPGALLLVGGGGDPYGTGCAETPTRSVLGVLDSEMTFSLVVEGPDKAADIEAYPEALTRAEEIGRQIVEAALRSR